MRTSTRRPCSRACRRIAASARCAHWGYVIKGRFTYRVGDREEVVEAGDAFYLPPGHAPVGQEPGSEMVQFSPSQELRETSQVIIKNMQETQGA